MKHMILGTAGHVDHGKTALIKALTGIECDTHKEEKQRGITINLGFAHLRLSSGTTIGIVDVPGHKDFVHTMVAGASGIDIACLVVAADEGVMPQTREHLGIMAILGMRSGVIALSKADLVDAEVLELAREEVRDLVKDTFLRDAPIIPVSSKTGEGIEVLREAIDACVQATAERPHGEVFRMFIDRIFTVSGFGTVVTGSAIGGKIRTGDSLYLLPGDKKLRIRRLEHHGSEVAEVAAGDRASINVVGLERGDFRRGMVVADRPLRTTVLVDARLQLFEHSRPVGLWFRGVFLLGAYEAQVRVHCIDRDKIMGGMTAVVQIHLPSPCVVQVGDRFVLRSTSSDRTVGGGEIIDAAPLHHRRRPPELVDHLHRIAQGKLPELLAAEVRKRIHPVGIVTVATDMNLSVEELTKVVDEGLPDDVVVLQGENGPFLVTAAAYERIAREVAKAVAAHHRRDPLDEGGATVEELLGKVGLADDAEGREALRAVLARLERQGTVKAVRHTWASGDHRVSVSAELKRAIGAVEGYFNSCGMQTPLTSELEAVARERGVDDRTLKQILRRLVVSRRVYEVEGAYLPASVVDEVRGKLLFALSARSSGLTVAGFRDLIDGNRKICLLLFALFDREGLTEREGDVRVLTDKGRAAAAQHGGAAS